MDNEDPAWTCKGAVALPNSCSFCAYELISFRLLKFGCVFIDVCLIDQLAFQALSRSCVHLSGHNMVVDKAARASVGA